MDYPEQVTTVMVPSELEPIQTKRLVLRPMKMSDAAGIFTFRSRQDVADWLLSKTPDSDISQTLTWMSKRRFVTPDASGALGRSFFFVVIRNDDPEQKIIGAVGVNSLRPAPSIGYGIHPEFWGLGYATEAVGGVVGAWWKLPRRLLLSEGEIEKEKLYAACNQANVGSVKVLMRNGFEIYAEVPEEGIVVAFMRIDR